MVRRETYNDVATAVDGERDAKRPDLDEHIRSRYEDLYFTKLKDWSFEYEFRFCKLVPESELRTPTLLQAESALVAVILGERFPHYALEGAARAMAMPIQFEVLSIGWRHGPVLTAVGA